MPSERPGLRVLLAGCGSIGRRHLANLVSMRSRGVGVCDPARAARAFARRLGVPVWTDYTAALREGPQSVVISTPAPQHVPMALEALRSGAHVFIEKPLSDRPAGVEGLSRLARRGRRVVQIGYNLRYHPGILGMRRLADSGRIGRILEMHTEFGLDLAFWWPGRDYRKSYMASRESGGGLIADCSHDIDMVRWFAGEVESVVCFAAKTSRLETDVDDAANILLRCAGGVQATIRLDCLQPRYTRTFKLVGEKGALFLDFPDGRMDSSNGRLSMTLHGMKRPERVPLPDRPGRMYRAEIEGFLDCVENGRSPEVGIEDGERALAVALGAEESARTGRVVRIP